MDSIKKLLTDNGYIVEHSDDRFYVFVDECDHDDVVSILPENTVAYREGDFTVVVPVLVKNDVLCFIDDLLYFVENGGSYNEYITKWNMGDCHAIDRVVEFLK
jgi:hypothetical protein